MESRSVRPRLETFVPIGSLNGFLQVGIQVALEFAAVREVPEFIAWARETFGTPFVLAALGETISSGIPSPAVRRYNCLRFWAWRRALSAAYELVDAESREDMLEMLAQTDVAKTEIDSSSSGDSASCSPDLTCDSDAGYLPASVAQDHIRHRDDSDLSSEPLQKE